MMAYDLKPVKVPKLRGLGLRLFTAMVESAWFRPLMMPSLLKNDPTHVGTRFLGRAVAQGSERPDVAGAASGSLARLSQP
jgi:hypothetical protein